MNHAAGQRQEREHRRRAPGRRRRRARAERWRGPGVAGGPPPRIPRQAATDRARSEAGQAHPRAGGRAAVQTASCSRGPQGSRAQHRVKIKRVSGAGKLRSVGLKSTILWGSLRALAGFEGASSALAPIQLAPALAIRYSQAQGSRGGAAIGCFTDRQAGSRPGSRRRPRQSSACAAFLQSVKTDVSRRDI